VFEHGVTSEQDCPSSLQNLWQENGNGEFLPDSLFPVVDAPRVPGFWKAISEPWRMPTGSPPPPVRLRTSVSPIPALGGEEFEAEDTHLWVTRDRSGGSLSVRLKSCSGPSDKDHFGARLPGPGVTSLASCLNSCFLYRRSSLDATIPTLLTLPPFLPYSPFRLNRFSANYRVSS